MPANVEYKVIQGSPSQIEPQLNTLSKEGWHPICMGGLAVGAVVAVILEKNISS